MYIAQRTLMNLFPTTGGGATGHLLGWILGRPARSRHRSLTLDGQLHLRDRGARSLADLAPREAGVKGEGADADPVGFGELFGADGDWHFFFFLLLCRRQVKYVTVWVQY